MLNPNDVIDNDDRGSHFSDFELDSEHQLIACVQDDVSDHHGGEAVSLRGDVVMSGRKQWHDVRALFVRGGMALQGGAEVE